MIKELLFAALVLSSFNQVVRAIVCTPNICDSVRCNNEAELNGCTDDLQVYRPDGGFCGCCGLCVTYIPVNGSCSSLTFGLGFPRRAECYPGTQCVNNICQTSEDT